MKKNSLIFCMFQLDTYILGNYELVFLQRHAPYACIPKELVAEAGQRWDKVMDVWVQRVLHHGQGHLEWFH